MTIVVVVVGGGCVVGSGGGLGVGSKVVEEKHYLFLFRSKQDRTAICVQTCTNEYKNTINLIC